jgi:hypothetical protein
MLYDGQLHNLESVVGFDKSFNAVNDNGEIIGQSQEIDFGAFIYRGGNGTVSLASVADPQAGWGTLFNNNRGQVVGISGQVPFLYDALNGMVDLNSLINPSSGWQLTYASAINDAGQIVGAAMINGVASAFLLTPIPEPSGIFLAGIGVLCLLVRCSVGRLQLRFQSS